MPRTIQSVDTDPDRSSDDLSPLMRAVDHLLEAHRFTLLDGDTITRVMIERVLRHVAVRLVEQGTGESGSKLQ